MIREEGCAGADCAAGEPAAARAQNAAAVAEAAAAWRAVGDVP